MNIKLPVFLLSSFLLVGVAAAAFDDVPSTHDNNDAISYVQEHGIVEGYDNGEYRPDELINRAEFTKIIVGAVFSEEEIMGEDCFEDVKDDWYAKYVCSAERNEIVEGFSDNYFRPEQNISFVEAAKVISLGFGAELDESDVWYEAFVENLSDSASIPVSITAFEQEITRGEMAEMIYRLLAEIDDKDTQTLDELNEGLGDSITMTITDGHDTDESDGGRPTILIAAALEVTQEQFQYAFSFVTPEDQGHLDDETAEANKAELLSRLEEYGVTNDRLDEVTDYYRYAPEDPLWDVIPAEIEVTIIDDEVVEIEIIEAGAGYSSEPTLSVPGYDFTFTVEIEYGTDLRTNGNISSVTLD
jgi:hypothetical protein